MGFGVAYVFVFVSHFPHFKISLACHSRGCRVRMVRYGKLPYDTIR